jgi:hypothetical protein
VADNDDKKDGGKKDDVKKDEVKKDDVKGTVQALAVGFVRLAESALGAGYPMVWKGAIAAPMGFLTTFIGAPFLSIAPNPILAGPGAVVAAVVGGVSLVAGMGMIILGQKTEALKKEVPKQEADPNNVKPLLLTDGRAQNLDFSVARVPEGYIIVHREKVLV